MGAAHVAHPLLLASSTLSHIDGHPGSPRCVPLHLRTSLQVAGLVFLNEKQNIVLLHPFLHVCVCVCLCVRLYQCTSWAAVAVLTRADPGVDATTTLAAALGPGDPRGPEDRLRTGHPVIAEPVEDLQRTDCSRTTAS